MKCSDGKYKGKECACEDCRHIDGICIDHASGSGCAVCEGPVKERCDLTEAMAELKE